MSFVVRQSDDITKTMLRFRIVKPFGRFFASIDGGVGYPFETVDHFVGLDYLNENPECIRGSLTCPARGITLKRAPASTLVSTIDRLSKRSKKGRVTFFTFVIP